MALLSGARLCVLRKNGEGVIREVPIRTSFVKFGSEVHCTIRLKSELTEQLHCKIFVRNDKVMIANYSSQNPISVDGKVITRRGLLPDGSTIEVCGTRFRWQFDESLLQARTEKAKKGQPTPTSSKFGKPRRTTMVLKKQQASEVVHPAAVTTSSRPSDSKKSRKTPTYTLPKNNKQLLKNIKKRFTMHSVMVDHHSDDEDEETEDEEHDQNESTVSLSKVADSTPKKLDTPDVSKNNTPFYTPDPEKENQTPVLIGKTPRTPKTPLALENSAMMILSYTPVIGPRSKANLQNTPLSTKKGTPLMRTGGYLTPKNENISMTNTPAKGQGVCKVGNSMYLIDLTSSTSTINSSFASSQSDASISSSAGLIDLTTPPSKKLNTPLSTKSVAKSAQKGLLRSALKNASRTPLSSLRSRLAKDTPKSVVKIRDSLRESPQTPVKSRSISRPTTPASASKSKLQGQAGTPAVDSPSVSSVASSKPGTPITVASGTTETPKQTPVMTTDELFDTLVGRSSVKKTYSRKSESPKKLPSPLVAVEGSTDLPKTDVDLWVESVMATVTSPEPLESFIKKPNRTTQVRSSQYSDITPHESFSDALHAATVDPQEEGASKDELVDPGSDGELDNMEDIPSIPNVARRSHTPLASKIVRSLGNKRQTIGNFFTNMFGKLTVSPVTRVSITDGDPSETAEDLEPTSEHESDGSEEVYHDSESDYPPESDQQPEEAVINPSPKLRQSLRDTRKFIGNALTSLNTSRLTMDVTADIDESQVLSDNYEDNISHSEAAEEHYDLTDLSTRLSRDFSAHPIADTSVHDQSKLTTPAKSTRKTFSRDFRAEISPMVGGDDRARHTPYSISTPADRKSTRQRPHVDISPLAVPLQGSPVKTSSTADSPMVEQETSMPVNDEPQESNDGDMESEIIPVDDSPVVASASVESSPVSRRSSEKSSIPYAVETTEDELSLIATDTDQDSSIKVITLSEENAVNSTNQSGVESSAVDVTEQTVDTRALHATPPKRVSRSSTTNVTQQEEQLEEESVQDVTAADPSETIQIDDSPAVSTSLIQLTQSPISRRSSKKSVTPKTAADAEEDISLIVMDTEQNSSMNVTSSQENAENTANLSAVEPSTSEQSVDSPTEAIVEPKSTRLSKRVSRRSSVANVIQQEEQLNTEDEDTVRDETAADVTSADHSTIDNGSNLTENVLEKDTQDDPSREADEDASNVDVEPEVAEAATLIERRASNRYKADALATASPSSVQRRRTIATSSTLPSEVTTKRAANRQSIAVMGVASVNSGVAEEVAVTEIETLQDDVDINDEADNAENCDSNVDVEKVATPIKRRVSNRHNTDASAASSPKVVQRRRTTAGQSTPQREVKTKRAFGRSITVVDTLSPRINDNANKATPTSESKLHLRVNRLSQRLQSSEAEPIDCPNNSSTCDGLQAEAIAEDVDITDAEVLQDDVDSSSSVPSSFADATMNVASEEQDDGQLKADEESSDSGMISESPVRRRRSLHGQNKTPLKAAASSDRLSMTVEKPPRKPANGTPLLRKAIFAMCTPTRTSRSSVTKPVPSQQERTPTRGSRSSRRTTVGELTTFDEAIEDETSMLKDVEESLVPVVDRTAGDLEAPTTISSPAKNTPRTRGRPSKTGTPASVRKSLSTTLATGSATPTTEQPAQINLSTVEHKPETPAKKIATNSENVDDSSKVNTTPGLSTPNKKAARASRRLTIAKESTPARLSSVPAEIQVQNESSVVGDVDDSEQPSVQSVEQAPRVTVVLSESSPDKTGTPQTKRRSTTPGSPSTENTVKIVNTPASARTSLSVTSTDTPRSTDASVQISDERINNASASVVEGETSLKEMSNESENADELTGDQSYKGRTPARASRSTRRSTMHVQETSHQSLDQAEAEEIAVEDVQKSPAIPTPVKQTPRSTRRASEMQTPSSTRKQLVDSATRKSGQISDASFVEEQQDVNTPAKETSVKLPLNQSVRSDLLDRTGAKDDVQVENQPELSSNMEELQESTTESTPIKHTPCARGRPSKPDTPVATPVSIGNKTPSSVRKSLLKTPLKRLEHIPETIVELDVSTNSATAGLTTPIKTSDISGLDASSPVTPAAVDTVFKTPRPVRGMRTPLSALKKTPATPVAQGNASDHTDTQNVTGRRSARRSTSVAVNSPIKSETVGTPISDKTIPENSSEIVIPFVVEETPRKSISPLEQVSEAVVAEEVSQTSSADVCPDLLKHLCERVITLEHAMENLEEPSQQSLDTTAANSTTTLEGIKHLLETPAATSTVRKTLRSSVAPARPNESVDLVGVEQLLRTPVDKSTSARKSTLQTSAIVIQTRKALRLSDGHSKLETTCDESNNLEGLHQMLQTPASSRLPKVSIAEDSIGESVDSTADLEGIQQLLKTPVAASARKLAPNSSMRDSSVNLEGVEQLLKTPAASKKPLKTSTAVKGTVCDTTFDMEGIQQMLATPEASGSVKPTRRATSHLEGVERLLNTPVANDSFNLEGIQQLLKTPAIFRRSMQCSTAIRPLGAETMDDSLSPVEHLLETPTASSSKELFEASETDSSALLKSTKYDDVATPNAKEIDTSMEQVIPASAKSRNTRRSTTASESANLEGIQRMLGTPVTARKSLRGSTAANSSNLAGVQELMTTPAATSETRTSVVKTPSVSALELESTGPDMEDVQQFQETSVSKAAADVSSASLNETSKLEGVQQLLKTPATTRKSLRGSTVAAELSSSVISSSNLTGVQDLLATPAKTKASEKNTPMPEPLEVSTFDATGVEESINSENTLQLQETLPAVAQTDASFVSFNDSSKLEGVEQMLKTPAATRKSLRGSSVPSAGLESSSFDVSSQRGSTTATELNSTKSSSTNLTEVQSPTTVSAALLETDLNESVDIEGVCHPAAAADSSVNFEGLQKMLATPVAKTLPNDSCDLEGVEQLLTTPAASRKSSRRSTVATELNLTSVNSPNLTGVQQLMATPETTNKSSAAPKTPSVDTNLDGVQQMFKTPVAPSTSRKTIRSKATKMNLDESIDFDGVQQLLRTPLASTPIVRSTRNASVLDSSTNLEGVEQLLKTPIASGISAIDNTTSNEASSAKESTFNSSAALEGVAQLLKTPIRASTRKTPLENSINLDSVEQLFRTPNPPSALKRQNRSPKVTDSKRRGVDDPQTSDVSSTTVNLDGTALNDTINMEGLQQLMETPAGKHGSTATVLEESVSLEGVEELLKTPAVARESTDEEEDPQSVASTGISNNPISDSDTYSNLFSPSIGIQPSSAVVNVSEIIQMLDTSSPKPVEDIQTKIAGTPLNTSVSLEDEKQCIAEAENITKQSPLKIVQPTPTPVCTKVDVNIRVASSTELGTPTQQRLRRKLYTKNDPDDKTPERIKSAVVRPVTSNEYLHIMDPKAAKEEDASEETPNRVDSAEEATDSEYEGEEVAEPVRKVLPSRASRRNIKTLSEEALAGASPELKYVKPKPVKVAVEPPAPVVSDDALSPINEEPDSNGQDLYAGRRKVMFNEQIQIKEINSPAIVGDIIQKVSRGRGGKYRKPVQVIVAQSSSEHLIKPARKDNKQDVQPQETTKADEESTSGVDASKRTRRGVKRVNYAEEDTKQPTETSKRARRGANKDENERSNEHNGEPEVKKDHTEESSANTAEPQTSSSSVVVTETTDDEKIEKEVVTKPTRRRAAAKVKPEPKKSSSRSKSKTKETVTEAEEESKESTDKVNEEPSEQPPLDIKAVDTAEPDEKKLDLPGDAATPEVTEEVIEIETSEEEPVTKRARRPAKKTKVEPKKPSSRAKSKKTDAAEDVEVSDINDKPDAKEAHAAETDEEKLATTEAAEEVIAIETSEEEHVAKRARRPVKKTKPEPKKPSSRARGKKTDTVEDVEVHETPLAPVVDLVDMPVSQESSHPAEDTSDISDKPGAKRSRRVPQKKTKDTPPAEPTNDAVQSSSGDLITTSNTENETHEAPNTEAVAGRSKRVVKKTTARSQQKTDLKSSESTEQGSTTTVSAVESSVHESSDNHEAKTAPKATATKGRQRRAAAVAEKLFSDISFDIPHQTAAEVTDTPQETVPTVPTIAASVVEQAVADSTSQDEPEPPPVKRGRNARKPAAKTKVDDSKASNDEQSVAPAMPPPSQIITPEPAEIAPKKRGGKRAAPVKKGASQKIVEEHLPELHHTTEESLNESHMVKTLLPSSHTSTPLVPIAEEKAKPTRGGRARQINPTVAALIAAEASTPTRRSPRTRRAETPTKAEDSQTDQPESKPKQSRARPAPKMKPVDDSHDHPHQTEETTVPTIAEMETTENKESTEQLPTSKARKNPPAKRPRGKATEQSESEEVEEIAPKRSRKVPAKYRDDADSGSASSKPDVTEDEAASKENVNRRGAKAAKQKAAEPTPTEATDTTNDETEDVQATKPSRSRKPAAKRPAAAAATRKKKVNVEDTEDDEASTVKQTPPEEEKPVETTSSRRRPVRTRK